MASTIKVNNIQNQCGANIINESANTITIGASGDTISLAAGASQTGFGRTGTVDWDTTKKTTSFTAVSGTGYFVDTSGGAVTATLPATPSAGDIVAFNDYARTFATNNLTIGRNGSNIQGTAADGTIATNGQSTMFVYVDGTQGWMPTEDQTTGQYGAVYITATGGTITTCGNCKIHTFTGPGTFTVCSLSNISTNNEVSYLVVAGGGGGGGYTGGGGAGGFREYKSSVTPYTASPLNGNPGGTAITVTATGYPITVGGGGAGGSSNANKGSNGGNSIFSTITSTGGGGGAGDTAPTRDGSPGGSGGANAYIPTNPVLGSVGAGNTPPVSPPQGNPSGNTNSDQATYTTGGGGGGATAAGGNASAPTGAPGGAGATTSINATPTAFAGGGGGGSDAPSRNVGPGGAGGGGKGWSPSYQTPAPERNATDNTGGGGGGGVGGSSTSGAGGSGIVIIRYKYQ